MNLRTEEKVKKEYVLFVLDESGSMEQTRKLTINGVNEQIQELKKTADKIETYVSLVTFNSTVKTVRWNIPLGEFEDIRNEEYIPNGMTSMLDAVGQSLSKLKNEVNDKEDDTSFLVIIVSDGEENNSREYDYNKVAAIISELKAKKNWTITYMGANQDLSEVTKSLNLDVNKVATWETSTNGAIIGNNTMRSSLSNYRNSRILFAASAINSNSYYTPTVTPAPVDPNIGNTSAT